MKIYGICVVQNEADSIGESLRWAVRFCDHIWVWDLASTDGTWERIQALNILSVTAERKEGGVFVNSVKGMVYNSVKDQIEDNSWVYIVDADEFFVGDPRPMLTAAEKEGATLVGTWQVNFLPTEKDVARLNALGEAAWTALPLSERFRYYRVEWFEHRFVRILPGTVWDTSGLFNKVSYREGTKSRLSRHFGFVRHYRYRSPTQVARRHATRTARPGIDDGLFVWTPSAEFQRYVLPARRLRHWNEDAGDLAVPWWEMQRARVIWTWWRALHHLQRRLGLRPTKS